MPFSKVHIYETHSLTVGLCQTLRPNVTYDAESWNTCVNRQRTRALDTTEWVSVMREPWPKLKGCSAEGWGAEGEEARGGEGQGGEV
jgi:hypothetical protein